MRAAGGSRYFSSARSWRDCVRAIRPRHCPVAADGPTRDHAAAPARQLASRQGCMSPATPLPDDATNAASIAPARPARTAPSRASIRAGRPSRLCGAGCRWGRDPRGTQARARLYRQLFRGPADPGRHSGRFSSIRLSTGHTGHGAVLFASPACRVRHRSASRDLDQSCFPHLVALGQKVLRRSTSGRVSRASVGACTAALFLREASRSFFGRITRPIDAPACVQDRQPYGPTSEAS